MDLQLQGKVALVTAASKGLGKAAAREFAREGSRVAICARSELVDSAAEEIRRETGAEVLAVRGDVSRQADVDALVKAALDRFGAIDILIVNAGGPPPGNFLDFQPKDWEEAFQLTVMSAVRLCYAVVPHMLERGSGSIVTSQSITVRQPVERLILANSLRLAVVGLWKTLANELGPKGIRVNSIHPSYVYTQRIEQLLAARSQAGGTTVEEEAAKMTASIPLGRMGSVEEYGRAIVWLASPAASFIHGHALLFDGGVARSYL